MFGLQSFVATGTTVAQGSFSWSSDPLMSGAVYGATLLAVAAGTGMVLAWIRNLSAQYALAARSVGRPGRGIAPVAVSRLAASAAAR